ncbi:MAG: ATPase, partial [Bacteroidota bacterium]
LAVARSLCGVNAGIACILGTGSNACFYDGTSMNSVSASMGYVLGDEGSGADLGKKLLAKVFRGHFSKELIDDFQEEFKLSAHEVIEKIYNQPRPNQFLSSFAPFIYKRRQNPEMNQMITDSLSDFFKGFFPNGEFNDYSMHFSGSIAYYYSDMLKNIGRKHGFSVENIVQSPISGLLSYHQAHG